MGTRVKGKKQKANLKLSKSCFRPLWHVKANKASGVINMFAHISDSISRKVS